ncbi:stathmin domain-containing protein 1 [Thunnus albacares]|uniref:stathmin domain-containing protein 1 n=1 Tax=Thunnus maccoyii TaxID=8240 RepID=UPI001C4ACB27|nr:stathmin domain-containing protein 1 [Thunnus maccoyii]XP_044191681.1 stathmin domain-containing protein 1 [Thunnus albacares]
MGCSSSTDTVIQPLRPDELNGDEDETGSKHGGRGDSAVSKCTTDSGVVMENRELPTLPGAVPTKPLPMTFVRENEADSVTQDAGPGLLQQESTMQERLKSSEILEELLNQGIIPVDQTTERGSGAGEAYDIMLDNREGVRRRPPARLESLKAKKPQHLPSREEIEEKIRLAEERRKLREDELKTRLRTKSARVRGPAPNSRTEVDEDATITPVEPLQSPLTPDPTPGPLVYSRIIREAAEGGECVRESGGDGRETKEEVNTAGKKEEMNEAPESGDTNREGRGGAERINEEEEEEELTQVEELKAGQLLSASGELESDSSFQYAEDKEEVF